jgi:hypothetical protein
MGVVLYFTAGGLHTGGSSLQSTTSQFDVLVGYWHILSFEKLIETSL